MAYIVVDTENTIFQKGNPFARRNRCCYLGLLSNGTTLLIRMPLSVDMAAEISRRIASATYLLGFNLKYDLHWLKRLGIDFTGKKLWCCQTARFMLENQRIEWWDNSLDSACKAYGIEGKLEGPQQYWESGVDTPDIPQEVMEAYLQQDLVCTEKVYQRQLALFEKQPKLFNLFRLDMDDLVVLQDMEYNGLKFNSDQAAVEEQKLRKRLEEIDGKLKQHCPNTPINFDSGDELSAYLYGGTIERDRREPVGLYKTGQKVGQVRYKVFTDTYTLPRLVEPLKGSHMKKGDEDKGPWKSSEDVLRELKQIKEIKLLLERAKVTKLLDYMIGLPELIKEKDWTPGELHGQFHQNRVRTGRLSSSDPNLQNMPDEVLKLVETRYGH